MSISSAQIFARDSALPHGIATEPSHPRRMKVAVSFPGVHRRGGVERVAYECVRFLSGRGHDVHVLASEWADEIKDFATIHRIPRLQRPWFLRDWSYHRHCQAALGSMQFDVLNTHGVVCPTGGVHWVQSVHAAWLERAKQMRPPFSLARFKQRVNPLHPVLLKLEEKHFRGRAYKKLITTTPVVRDDLHRIYGVPLQDVEIIPNGYSPTEFSPELRAERRSAMRQKLGLNEDHITLLLVANELQRKGYRTILGAMKILNDPNLRLLVVGKPPIASVQSMAANFNLSDQVIACGPTAKVAEYHAAADLFVLPTEYEAFCLAILEALASGLPVITSSVPGAADAIQPGINGQIIQDPKNPEELASALRPLLDETVRIAYSASAPQSVTQYAWPTVLQKYEAQLQSAAFAES